MDPKKLCPCFSSKPYSQCCQIEHKIPIHKDPEKLMRSRYSAYVLKNAQYILETTHPQSSHFMADRFSWTQQVLQFCEETEFYGLIIHSINTEKDRAWVEFTAQLRQGFQEASFRENSLFLRKGKGFLYFDAQK